MKKILAAVLALFLAAGALAACAAQAPPAAGSAAQAPATQSIAEAQSSLSVVATIFPYYDFARAIAGSEENLHMLLKPGSESHSYEPSAADILTIQAADIFVYTGGHTDDWVDKILEAVDNPDLVVVRMMDYVSTMEEELVEGMQEEEHGHEEGEEEKAHGLEETETDEHIWTAPTNAIALVNALCGAFAAKNEGGAETYRQNAEAYTQQLAALDGEFRTVVQNASSKLLVFGDRFPFRYFTEAYGLSYYAAFAGCSTDSNASAGTIAFLVDIVRRENIPYIFKIELSSGSIAKTISEETGCAVLSLESCHNVTPAQFAAGETYLSLMRQNAETLKTALA